MKWALRLLAVGLVLALYCGVCRQFGLCPDDRVLRQIRGTGL